MKEQNFFEDPSYIMRLYHAETCTDDFYSLILYNSDLGAAGS